MYHKYSKIPNTHLFSSIMLVIRVGIYKMLVRIANREDPDQTRLLLQKQSNLGLPYLSRPFWQAASVQNFRIFTITSFRYCETYFSLVFRHLLKLVNTFILKLIEANMSIDVPRPLCNDVLLILFQKVDA